LSTSAGDALPDGPEPSLKTRVVASKWSALSEIAVKAITPLVFEHVLGRCRDAFLLYRFHRKEHLIFTHLTNREKLTIYNLARQCRGRVFVEIGSYYGASASFIASGIRRSRVGGTLYCVDTWQNDTMPDWSRDTFERFSANTRPYRDIIVPLRGKSTEVAKCFNEPVDFLFIDGDHSYEAVKADVRAWLPKLSSNAVIVFHDIGWAKGVQKVVAEEVAPRAKTEGRLPNLYWAVFN
jgi:predicted O-methyltransferase YrrM